MRLEEEAEHIVEVCIKHLPASEGRLKQYAEAQVADPVFSSDDGPYIGGHLAFFSKLNFN